MSKIQARKMSQACKQHGAKMIKKKKIKGKGEGGGGHATEGMKIKNQNQKPKSHELTFCITEGLQRDCCVCSSDLALRSTNQARQKQSNAACFTRRNREERPQSHEGTYIAGSGPCPWSASRNWMGRAPLVHSLPLSTSRGPPC